MALFELTAERLSPVPTTNFTAEHVLERDDLQRLLRARIEVIADDVMVVAEEFGAFADARRRIDLLGVDRAGHLVVIELKRTTDGGHLELQALRYAAMVSAMTFDDLVEHHAFYLRTVDHSELGDARTLLASWLDDGEDTVLSRQVRLVLVAAGFDREITTTVLWLNDIYGLDIRCVRLVPYRLADRILLDVQQVIPLPEASELTIQLRRRESQVRAAKSDGPDWTPYVIESPAGRSAPLRKRQAVLAMVCALAEAGVAATVIASVLPRAKFLDDDGNLDGEELETAFVSAHPSAAGSTGRWFLDRPIADDGKTWVLSKMWGLDTEAVLTRLSKLAPGFGFEAQPTQL
jgi:hypothetical protein